ncbi:uncharacterized protein LOC144548842 [Carex rostrata]
MEYLKTYDPLSSNQAEVVILAAGVEMGKDLEAKGKGIETEQHQIGGVLYTWSNGRESPTMAKLDRCLISMNWSLLFPNSTQRTLPNSSSDHCPVLYQASTTFKRSAMFRVENFWLQSQQFKDFVKNEWERVGNIKKQLGICRDYFGWVDKVQEIWQITELEKLVKAILKNRYTELSVLEEHMWRQRAKIRWELQGDKNMKFFHSYASASKRNNFIGHVEYNGVICTDQKMKAKAFFDFYINLMGKEQHNDTDLDWNALYPIRHDLSILSRPIEQEEVLQVISQWPNN